jgi:hypothetical protein
MDFMQEYVARLKKDIQQLRAKLEPLEAGDTHLAERHGKGSWVDITAREIDHLKRAIANIEAVLARHSDRPLPGHN